MTRRVSLLFALFSLSSFALIGCGKKPQQAAASGPPILPVSRPVVRNVTDFAEYTGRTDAVNSVSVRARVTGYLTKMPFEEGSEVKENDLLFEIDPRPYQALVDQANSQVDLYQAQLKLARSVLARDTSLMASSAVSPLQIDQDKASVEEVESRIKVAQASVDSAKLNLSFTQVRAKISGRISRYYYTLGNIVTQDQTLLTTIVSMDPMYAYFEVEERTFQRMQRSSGGLGLASVVGVATGTGMPVSMALEGEDGFPHRGKINFINNQVNPSTGTVAVRGLFKNRQSKAGLWSLLPGMFVRVRLPLGDAFKATLVIDRAIGSDQGLKFVYIVDGENKAQYRRVKTGSLQEDGLRVIEPYAPATATEPETGVKPEEWVIVGGLQSMRPRMEIKPEQSAMPTQSGGEMPTRRKPQAPAPGEKQPTTAKNS